MPVMPRSHLRWYQFSLAALLGCVTLVGLLSSWLAVKLRQAKAEQNTVAALVDTGGYVEYDFHFDSSGNRIVSAKSPVPLWLLNLIGVDFFSDVAVAHVKNDKGMEIIHDFSNLQGVDASISEVTNGGLVHLGKIDGLKWLDVSYTKISGDIETIEGLSQLRSLDISNSDITDEALKHIVRLSGIRYLDLSNTNIGDYGLERLDQLSQIEYLNLKNTHVTDDGLKSIGRLHSLHVLCLWDTAISDAGVECLKTLTELRDLSLRGTKCADCALVISST